MHVWVLEEERVNGRELGDLYSVCTKYQAQTDPGGSGVGVHQKRMCSFSPLTWVAWKLQLLFQ